MSADPHADLRRQFHDLQRTYDSMLLWEPTRPKPPIIDSSVENDASHKESLPGQRAFLEAIERDLDVMEKFLTDPQSAGKPSLSTNALYLVSVWQEVLLASPPVIAIGKTFHHRAENLDKPSLFNPNLTTGKQVPVKIDVVADNGKTWIRVNTTKNSRLLSEFREIDSYLTDSDSDSETSDQDARPSLAQKEFDNSLLRQGRALLAAAAQNLLPFPSSPSGSSHLDDSPPRPKVVFRLTRLDPLSQLPRDNDPRIALTVKMLEEMGIEVQLGPHPPPTSSPSSRPTRRPTTFKPTRQINLDLSILIALVSDLTHASLPQTDKEADERFIPSQAYMEWRKSKLRAKIYADLHKGGKVGATSSSNRKNVSKLVDQADGEGDGEGKDADGGGLEHSRALAEQLKQEMKKGLLNEMMDRVTDSFDPASASTECNDRQQGIEFWTTKEARDRCLRIVSKIGGPNEKRRAHALFASTSSSDDAASSYWKDSRYSKNFVPLHPIHIFPTSQPPDITLETAGRSHTREPFFRALEETCRFLLSTEIAPHPRALPASLISGSGPATSVPSTVGSASPVGDEDEIVGDEIQRASVMKANPKLTAHTVQSMLWGAVSDEGNGWTTITANRASVRAMIREMKGRSGVVSGGDWLGGGIGRPTDTNGQDAEGSGTGANMEVGRAAIWTVDPRSLAEGMRSDYVA